MNNLLIWPVALPLLSALLALLWPRRSTWIGVAGAGLSLSAVLLVSRQVVESGPIELALGGWTPGLGIALRSDGLSLLMLLMSSLVAMAVAVYASVYFSHSERRGEFWVLWLVLVTALHALFLSGDLFNLYVTLELLGLSAVVLACLGGSRASLQAALRYLVLGLQGSLAFLMGVALIYAGYGTLDMAALGDAIEAGPTAWVALSLMTGGLLIKSALFPLHFWLPPAHANAPAPVSAVLSALVVKAALYLILRLWLELFDGVVTQASAMIIGVLGAVAVLWGSWAALQAERLKLMAAYSTIAQLGYLFLFLPLLAAMPEGEGRDLALGALVLLALTHGFAKSAFFLAAGIIMQRAGHDRIAELGGTARALPVTAFTLALAGVALIGLPPSGSFLAKWQLLSTVFVTGQWLWLPVIAVGTLLAGAYIFRLLGHAFGPGEGVGPSLSVGREEIPAVLLALIATLLLGFWAAAVWELVPISAYAGGEA
ncbi:MAG: oxidoreductase [Candidatus Thiodiazotropha sp. (ex Cardiolucina cf. quadrata)]|nr:oxidoreductase [Candidatus Thiodiazotropha sp. (ex Cardiolucina cf. quadrata)]